MITKKAILALAVLLGLIFMQGQVEAQPPARIKTMVRAAVNGSILVKMMQDYENQEATADAGFFQGYVLAVGDLTSGVHWDPGTQATTGKLWAVASNYLKKHPERWHESAESIIVDALREAFPITATKRK